MVSVRAHRGGSRQGSEEKRSEGWRASFLLRGSTRTPPKACRMMAYLREFMTLERVYSPYTILGFYKKVLGLFYWSIMLPACRLRAQLDPGRCLGAVGGRPGAAVLIAGDVCCGAISKCGCRYLVHVVAQRVQGLK